MTINFEMVSDALDNAGVKLYDGYSGRCMYGETCWGFVGSDQDLAMFFAYIGSEDVETAVVLAGALRTDNMACDTIYYFPGIKIADNPDREEEETESEI